MFAYDAAGKLVAEYSAIVAPSNDAKVAYLTNDHLGSPRINTDQNGIVAARHDYHPFGEEIATVQRIPGLGYADDTVRKQFTGYERDTETDLDFAQARMYANRLGRFTTVDPIFISPERLLDPQRINLFIYTRNNPYKFVDATGEDIVLAEGMTEKQLNQLVEAMYAAYKTVEGKTFFDGEATAETTLTLAVGPVSDIDAAAYGDTTIGGNDNITITLDLEKRESLKAAGAGKLGNQPRGNIFSRERQEGVTIAVPESLEKIGKHEVSHGIDARKNPEQFRRDAEKENREKTPAKDRATEQRRAAIQKDLGNRDVKDKQKDFGDFKKLIGYDKYKVKSEEKKKD